jgi:hypothetical protein
MIHLRKNMAVKRDLLPIAMTACAYALVILWLLWTDSI